MRTGALLCLLEPIMHALLHQKKKKKLEEEEEKSADSHIRVRDRVGWVEETRAGQTK